MKPSSLTFSAKKLVVASMLAAMTCVATMLIQIPLSANGYVNMGDAVVLFSAYLLGPVYGGAAAGIGSMFADIFSVYPVYAVATLIIKSLMAVASSLIFTALSKTKIKGVFAPVVAGICGETIMVVGYFLFAAIFLHGNAAVAATEIPGNLLQAAFGLVVSTILNRIIKNFDSAHGGVFPKKG